MNRTVLFLTMVLLALLSLGGQGLMAQDQAPPPCTSETSEGCPADEQTTEAIVIDLNHFVSETIEIVDLARIKRETAPPPLTVIEQRQKGLVDAGHPFIPEGFLNAAKEGDEALVLRYLQADMPPSATLTTGQTALHFAVLGNRTDIAQMLLSYNANPNAQNERGDSPLHMAVEKNQPYMVALLISEGADPNLKNRDGWNPLHLAAYNGYSEVAALLLKYDAPINTQNSLGLTPLMLAIWKGHERLALFLLSQNADIAPEDPQGNNAFLMAVSHNHINLVRTFLEKGADPNTANGRGWAALDIALESQFREVANLLYAAGAHAPGLARTQGRILNAR